MENHRVGVGATSFLCQDASGAQRRSCIQSATDLDLGRDPQPHAGLVDLSFHLRQQGHFDVVARAHHGP
jgi:hypothetical protein